MPKPFSAQKSRKRTTKRRYRLFTLAEESHPLSRVSGMEIFVVVVFVLVVAYFI